MHGCVFVCIIKARFKDMLLLTKSQTLVHARTRRFVAKSGVECVCLGGGSTSEVELFQAFECTKRGSEDVDVLAQLVAWRV